MMRCGKCRRVTDTLVVSGAKPGTIRKYPVCKACHDKAVKGFNRGLRAIFPRTPKPQEG